MSRKDLPNLPRLDGPLSHPFYSHVVKRALDLLLALILLIPGIILMIPLAVWVKLDSPGPVLYKAVRGGYHNQPFMIWKFRSMVVGADRTGGTTAKNDSRVTRAGRVMRKLKLDELPQLFNIIRGEMSFVGPRPELLLYTNRYTEEEQCIMWVRPGVNFERLVLPQKNRMRVEYARNQSFPLDWRLFWETLGGVFKKAEKAAKEKM